MPSLPVLTFPDPFLKKKAAPVTQFDESLKKLVKDMSEAMYESAGIGLAAPQVGVGLRMFIVDLNYRGPDTDTQPNPVAYCNPVLRDGKGSIHLEEGCLSLPEFRAEVERFEELTLEYQDINGHHHSLHAEGLFAVCIQHETDHLNGKLFIDYLPPLRKKMIEKRLKKMAQ